MDKEQAKIVLGLSEDFTQFELLESYKKNVETLCRDLESSLVENEVALLANDIHDKSTAYLELREIYMPSEQIQQQPLIIFTDASYFRNKDYASFGIVVKNINQDFSMPLQILEKYNIHIEPESCADNCVLSGIIANASVNITEMIAIVSALDIFQYLAKSTGQSIVFYTDSLVSKKILSGKNIFTGSQMYSEIKKMFNNIIGFNELNVKIKKVAAHAGIELNELADRIAKRRLTQYVENQIIQ